MAPARRAPRLHRGGVTANLERYRLLADNRRLRLRERSRTRTSAPILDSVPDGIIGLDVHGRITFANPAAAAMIGYSVDELYGQPIRTHMQFSGPTSAIEPNGDVGIQAPVEESCWRGDGTSFPIECQTAPLSSAGHVVGSVLTFRDISHRRAVEQMKDELISVVSHELRTPLTSIRSALGLLVAGVLGAVPENGQRMLHIAVKNTDRLIRLINDTLDLERVNSGDFRMERVECDAVELMTRAAEGVRALADEADVTLEVSPSTARLWADPDRLLQVLTNLLSNAVKFSLPGGGAVWMEAEASADELTFRVRDEGRGIPADKLEAIFERFGQVDVSDAREKGGAGLGLAICRSIVKQHGGQIWVESTLGAGTTVCVALPLGETARPRLLAPPISSAAAAAAA